MGVDVEAGRTYWWCACGRSARQPFCDGSHKGTGITPVKYDATEAGTVWFCACKQSARSPLCDGTHKRL
jgi:CDGSH-type Zn-finger protein